MIPRQSRRREFDAEVRRAVSYEKGLAVKALISVALVVVVIVVRLLGG
jgi:hypothetical protein